MILTPELQKQIEQEAKAEANKLTGRVPIFRMGYEAGHYDGAELYAEKWQEAEHKIKELRQWQEEAGSLLDPLLEWGQAQKDIPLGKSITSEILRRAKLLTEAEARAERYEKALKEIVNLPKPINEQAPFDTAVGIATKALNPKTSTDDTANG